MGTQEREKINLNELTEREMLILLARQAEALEKKCDRIEEASQRASVKLNTLETKVKVWGAIAAFITTIFTLIIDKLLKF